MRAGRRSMRRPASRFRDPLMARAGITPAELARRCGMSYHGIRRCLMENRTPRNPLAAAPYCAALGLPAPVVPGPSAGKAVSP